MDKGEWEEESGWMDGWTAARTFSQGNFNSEKNRSEHFIAQFDSVFHFGQVGINALNRLH